MVDAAPQVVHTVGEAARGPNSYKTLAECVAAASAGDMVMVLPGVYEERVHIPFPLDVVGRVKGKVRICPPPESALSRGSRCDCSLSSDSESEALSPLLRPLPPYRSRAPRTLSVRPERLSPRPPTPDWSLP